METELPNNWILSNLDNLFNLIYGKGLPTTDFTNEGYDVYGANGIIGKYKNFLYEKSKVIISCRGAASGTIHKTNPKSFITSNSIILDEYSDQLLNLSFVKYAMLSIDKSTVITGTAQPQITIQLLKNLKFPLAPLPEQSRIVAKLDALFTHTDTLKTKLDRIPELLKNFRQQVLTQAVTGKLTEEWREGKKLEEWKEVKLNKCGVISGGITLNSKRSALPIKKPYLRVANVYFNQIKLDEIKTVGVLENEIKRTFLEKGDLLIVEGNGSPDQIGRVAQWQGEIDNCLHQNHLIKFRCNNYFTSRYILYYLLSKQGRKQIELASKSTSGLYTLSTNKVSNLNIFLPSSEIEQQEIVGRIEDLFLAADTIEKQYQNLKEKIDSLPQAILNKAFKGELVPQDPNDEPASALLERIKKESKKMR